MAPVHRQTGGSTASRLPVDRPGGRRDLWVGSLRRGPGGDRLEGSRSVPRRSRRGPDVSRSASGRAGAEGIWVPTALLPRFGVTWTAADAHHVSASYRLDDTEIELRMALAEDGRVRSVAFDRWGDPDNSATWRYQPFGFEVTDYATFGGVSIPSRGRAGWFYGTDRWTDGEFFRCEIVRYQLLSEAPA